MCYTISMKTRIKVKTNGLGTIKYIPQYKFFIWWIGIDYGQFTLKHAEQVIDDFIYLKKVNQILDVNYIKYP